MSAARALETSQALAMEFAGRSSLQLEFTWHSAISDAIRQVRRKSSIPATTPLRGFDLFAGIGGFRLAMELCGVACVGACEIDPSARATYLANFGHLPLPDVRTIDAKTIPDVDVITGGFPCQGVSLCGKRRGFSDPRTRLFFKLARIIERKQPKIAILENVPRLLTKPCKGDIAKILRRLRRAGYDVNVWLLDSKNYGVPQSRQRVFFACFRADLKIGENVSPPPHLQSTSRIRDILQPDCDELRWRMLRLGRIAWIGRKEEKIRACEDGARDVCRIGWIRDGSQGDIIHHPSGLAPTHVATSGWSCGGSMILQVGQDQYRSFTPTEARRLMGFPENFRFIGSDADVLAQLGNAVVVPAAAAVIQRALEAVAKSGLS